MEPLTYSLLVSVGTRESLDLLLALLEVRGTVDQLTARTGIAEATVSRRLKDLSTIGLVHRERPRDPYVLTAPEETRQLLEAGSALSTRLLVLREEREEVFARQVQKTRLRNISAS